MRSGAPPKRLRAPQAQAHRRRTARVRRAPLLAGLAFALGAIVLIGPVGGLAGGPGATRPASPETRSGQASRPVEPAGNRVLGAGAALPADLPACRYADDPAVPDPDGDWTLAILDTIVRLPAGYAPQDLVRRSATPGCRAAARCAPR